MKAALALLPLVFAGCIQLEPIQEPVPDAVGSSEFFFASAAYGTTEYRQRPCGMAMPPIERGENETLIASAPEVLHLLERAWAVVEYSDWRPICSTPTYYVYLENGQVAVVSAGPLAYQSPAEASAMSGLEPHKNGSFRVLAAGAFMGPDEKWPPLDPMADMTYFEYCSMAAAEGQSCDPPMEQLFFAHRGNWTAAAKPQG